MEYTKKSYPTKYKGTLYRSRLEAHWAALFDLLGWDHIYEPFDAGMWSPDFLISGKTNLLVEVKPITNIAQDKKTLEKIQQYFHENKKAGKHCEPLILGLSPHPALEWWKDRLTVGWLGETNWEYGQDITWADALLIRRKTGKWDIGHGMQGWNGRIDGFGNGDADLGSDDDAYDIQDLWQEAGNMTQWGYRRD